MTNLDSILKNKDITLPTKVQIGHNEMKRTVVGCKTEDRKGQRKNTGQYGQKGDNDEKIRSAS